MLHQEIVFPSADAVGEIINYQKEPLIKEHIIPRLKEFYPFSDCGIEQILNAAYYYCWVAYAYECPEVQYITLHWRERYETKNDSSTFLNLEADRILELLSGRSEHEDTITVLPTDPTHLGVSQWINEDRLRDTIMERSALISAAVMLTAQPDFCENPQRLNYRNQLLDFAARKVYVLPKLSGDDEFSDWRILYKKFFDTKQRGRLQNSSIKGNYPMEFRHKLYREGELDAYLLDYMLDSIKTTEDLELFINLGADDSYKLDMNRWTPRLVYHHNQDPGLPSLGGLISAINAKYGSDDAETITPLAYHDIDLHRRLTPTASPAIAPATAGSDYKIAKEKKVVLTVVLDAMCEVGLFERRDGGVFGKMDFIKALSSFFGEDMKISNSSKNVNQQANSRSLKDYLEIFDKLKETAKDTYQRIEKDKEEREKKEKRKNVR